MSTILNKEAREFVKVNGMINIINPSAIAEEFDGKNLVVKGKSVIDLTRMDYLSVGSSEEVRQIMIDSLMRINRSCPASQKIMKTAQNVSLEKAVANLHGMNNSLVFTNGYSANLNMMEALGLRMNTSYLSKICRKAGMGKETRKMPTLFFMDGDSHFSLQHGANLAGAQTDSSISYHYPTMNYEKLEKMLVNSYAKHGDDALRIIVSDTLASTNGVIFDVNRLCQLAEKYNCILYLDEAHAAGAMGVKGGGIASACEAYGRNKHRIILMGTLTKTFSQLGGYVSIMDNDLSEFMEFFCPQYIFSAPVPPWMADALVNIISLVSGEWGDIGRVKLNETATYMRGELSELGFNIMGSTSHIIPVYIGDDEKATAMMHFFQENGYVVSCFRYPAVPVSSALIRFSICSDITKEEVADIVGLLKQARDKFMV